MSSFLDGDSTNLLFDIVQEPLTGAPKTQILQRLWSSHREYYCLLNYCRTQGGDPKRNTGTSVLRLLLGLFLGLTQV